MNKEKPRISIIIPVYNTEEYLRECLDSVVNQTLKDIEIILIDDGSTDNSSKICDEYKEKDNRITVIHQSNQGTAISRNKGIDLAKGEYLYFLDSDDYIVLDMLEKMFNKIEQEDADIVICKFWTIHNNKIRLTKNAINKKLLPPKSCFNVNDIPENIFQICTIPTWTKLYKKDFIDKNEIKYQNLSSCNDHFFNDISLVLANRITYIEEPLVYYRYNINNSITSKRYLHAKNIFKASTEIKSYLKKIRKFKLVEKSFYKISFTAFMHEKQFLKSNKAKLLFYIQAIFFFPKRFFINSVILVIKQKIIYHTYIILLKLGMRDRVKKILKNSNLKLINRKQKILLVSHELTYTGAPKCLFLVCKILLKNNYNVEVWSLKDGEYKKEFKKLGVDVKIVPNTFIYKREYKLYIKNNFNLVICNTVLTDNFYSIIKYFVPAIWYIHEGQNIAFCPPMIINNIKKANNIYCVSEYAKDFIVKNYKNKAKVIHNAVEDFAKFFPEHKYFNNSKLNLLMSGLFGPRKGFDILIRAIKLLPKDLQEKIELNIIGKSNNGEYSVKILKEIENMPNVNYLGLITNQREMFELYNKTDIVVIPSRDESCSLVALEAIMMSCPIIISENVGAKYVIDSNTGWIFKNGNVEQLKNILIDILNNKYDISNMGKCARKKYEETSSLEIYEFNVLKMIGENINNKKLIPKLSLKVYFDFFIGKISILYSNIKQKIIYVIYIILLKLGIKNKVKNFLLRIGFKFNE